MIVFVSLLIYSTGLDTVDTGRIFNTLMTRLGYSTYFIQGGDWGSAIGTAMAQLYPE